MLGKYSPTVSAAYSRDQKWFEKYAVPKNPDDFAGYELEGYDSYDADGVDRAKVEEFAYAGSPYLYEDVLEDWDFDGVKPVLSSYALKVKESDNEKAIQDAVSLLTAAGYSVTKA